MSTQAETYYWIGGAVTPEGEPDNSWNNPINWSIDNLTPQNEGDPVPGSDTSDTVNLATADTIDIDDEIEIASLTTTGSAKLKVTGKLIINDSAGDYDISQLIETDSSGTIKTTGTFTISTQFTASSLSIECNTIDTQEALTAKSLTIHDSTEFTKDVTLESFVASNLGGKTISLNNCVIQADSITLTGNSASSILAIEGIGSSHTVDTSNLTAEYISIDDNIVLENYSTTIENCVPAADNSDPANWLTVINNGWNLEAPLKQFTFTWKTDASSNEWNDGANWDTGFVPDTDCKIIIPGGCTNYPELTAGTYKGGTLTLSDSTSKITLVGSDLSLSGKENETTASSTLSNAGTIVYSDAGRIKKSGTVLNDSTQGTTKYAGTITSFDFTNYFDLVISGSCTINSETTVQANSITFDDGGLCTIKKETTLTAKTFSFNGSSTNINAQANVNINLIAENPSLTTNVTIPLGLASKVSMTTDGTLHLTNDSAASLIFSDTSTDPFEYKLNFHNPVILQNDIKVQNSVTANGNISGTGTLIFAGTGNPIFNAGTYTHENIKSLKGNNTAKLTINGDCTITNFTIEGRPTTFSGTPEITTSFTDSETNGNITFNAGANITPDVSTGTVTVKGTISAASFAAIKLVVSEGNASISTTGTQSYGTIDGTAAVTQNLILTASTVTFNDNIGANKKLDTLSINADISIGSTEKKISAKEIDFSGNISGSGKKLILDTNILKSTSTSTDASITLDELQLTSNVNFISTKELELSASKTEFLGNVNFSGAKFNASTGTVIITSDSTAITLTGSNNAAIPTTFNNLTITGSANINGYNTVNETLEASGLGNKTLTFEAGKTQTVTNLILSGASKTSQLTLTSDGTWTIESTNPPTLQYLSVKKANNNSGYKFTAIDSSDNGGNTNWHFPHQNYTWIGGTTDKEQDWNTAANWTPESIPGKGAEVTIPANTTYYPVLTENLDIAYAEASSEYGTITVNGKFDLSQFNLKVYSITNNGTVYANGVSGQKIEGKVINGDDSIVEYNGAGNSNFFWDGSSTTPAKKQYQNLILNQATSGNAGKELSADGTVSIMQSSTLECGFTCDKLKINADSTLEGAITCNTLSINAESILSGKVSVINDTIISVTADTIIELNNSTNQFGGNIIAGNSTGATPFSAGKLTLNAGSQIKLANNANANTLTINCPVLPQNVTTSGNQTYNGNVTISNAAQLLSNGEYIYFNGTTTGSAKLTTTGAATAKFTGNVSNLEALETQTVDFNCETLSTTGNQTYNGAVTISKAGGAYISSSAGIITFEATSAITGTTNKLKIETGTATTNSINFKGNIGSDTTPFVELEIGDTYQAVFEKTVYLSTLTDSKSAGTLILKNDLNITNPVTFNRSIKIDGNINITTIGTINFNGTIDGTTANTDILTLNSNTKLITFSNDVGQTVALKTLNINGPATISKTLTFTADNITLNTSLTSSTETASTLKIRNCGTFTAPAASSTVSNINLLFTGTAGTKTNFIPGTSEYGNITTDTIELDFGAYSFEQSSDASFTINSGTVKTGTGNLKTGNLISKGSIINTSLIEVKKDFTDEGSYSGDGLIKFTGTAEQIFTPGTSTYSNIENTSADPLNVSRDVKAKNFEIKSGKTTTFNGTTQITNLRISDSENTTFTDSVTITNFDDTDNTGTITFKNDGTILTSTIIHTPNEVTLTGTLEVPSIQIDNLIVDGTANINTTISQTYNNINGKTADTDILNLDSGSGQINFNGNVGNNLPIKKLEVKSRSTISCDSITTSGEQIFSGAITLNTTPATHTLSASSITLNANSTIDGVADLELVTTDGTSFNANVGASTPLTNLTVTGPTTISCGAITTSENQQYNNEVIFYSDSTLTSTTGNLNFASTIDGNHTITFNVPFNEANTITVAGKVGETAIPSITIAQGGNTNFENSVQISNFTDTTNAGNVTFLDGGTISTATEFHTTGIVTIGDEVDDEMIFGTDASKVDLTHTSGETSITGTVAGANITLGTTTGGPMTITNSGIFKTEDGKSLSYTTSFTQNGSGNNLLGGSFTGNGNASFATDVYLYGDNEASFGTESKTITINGNLLNKRDAALTTNATISVSKDFIVTKGDITANAPITTTQNLVLYKGDFIANADISAAKDIIILGSSYSETDSTTGITNEYAYTAPRHSEWSQPNYTTTTLPDGTELPSVTDYAATLSVKAGSTIRAGKNFYANGTTFSLNGISGQWILKLPDITNPANGFAEAYHSVVTNCNVICSDGSSDGSKAKLVTLDCTDRGSNNNVDFEDFKITNAYTVRDNAIYVEFNRPIRYHSSTINSLYFHNNNDTTVTGAGGTSFTGFYRDADCTNQIIETDFPSYVNTTDGETYWYFYIKASPQNGSTLGAWNTDATGRNAGTEKSSDRHGVHHTTLPCLDFPRSLTGTPFILTDIWGKRLNNYSHRLPKSDAEPAYGSQDSAYSVTDQTGPVLWTVRTGQELHNTYDNATGETSQHSYDSHNFLEFRYSEPVNFGSDNTSICDVNIPAYSTGTTPNVFENLQVTDKFGALSGSITSATNTLTFTGLARFTAPAGNQLLLYTGSLGTANKYVNALYRNDEYSLRVSIAGWTDGTVTDYSGNEYKKWPGYIENATQFTGAQAHTVAVKNQLVKDQAGNPQIEYAENKPEPLIYSDSTSANPSNLISASPDLYSQWDLSSPVFTPLRFSKETEWGNQDMSEAIGNTNGSGSTLDRIDFHFFDNTPAYSGADTSENSDTAEWFTEIGWCKPGTEASRENLFDSSYTYSADIIGGARQFDTDSSRRTAGGIRFSSKVDIAQAFRYSTDLNSTTPDSLFLSGLDNVHTTIISQLFTGSISPMHAANDPDGLYLGLGLSDTNLSVETTFAFSYNENQGYLTDLAGNRLRTKVSKTVDRTPPSFDIILSPVNQNKIYIVFVKKIQTNSDDIKYTDTNGKQITTDFLNLIPGCFRIISIAQDGTAIPSTDLQIDTSTPAQVLSEYSNENFTTISLTLNRDICLNDIKNLYIQIIHHPDFEEESKDPFTRNDNSKVTFIQDNLGNYMGMYSAHALSDFAINLINPIYAYSSDITDNSISVMDGLYEGSSWAVHDWNADQQNYGTLPEKHPAAIVTSTQDGTKDASQNPQNVRIYLSDSPDADSVSSQFNKDLGTKLRVWIPDLTDGYFRALTAKNNTNYTTLDSELLTQEKLSDGLIFNIPLEIMNTWKNGDQISFMFGITNSDLTPLKIYTSPYYDVADGKFKLNLSTPVPLYSLRMSDVSDIGSLDLWSFRLKGITGQRGGVTILNNVINPEHGEKTVVKLNLSDEAKVNITVLTLDGNIITYLNRGKLKAGEHWFTWNGKNKAGTSVARGMYFIRITGSGIDETRKVMVVK